MCFPLITMPDHKIVMVLIVSAFSGSCLDYPDDWKGSTWKDEFSGTDVSFTDNGMSGMNVNIVGKLINQWTCFLKKNDMVVSRSVSVVSVSDVDAYVYICQKYKRISNSFYSYYLMSTSKIPKLICDCRGPLFMKNCPGTVPAGTPATDEADSGISCNRVVVEPSNYYKYTFTKFYMQVHAEENFLTLNDARVYTKIQSSTITDICDVCNNGDPKPSDSEYYVMRKDGGDVNINLTALYPACAVVGCNQCTSSCSDSDTICSSSSKAVKRYSHSVPTAFVCVIFVGFHLL